MRWPNVLPVAALVVVAACAGPTPSSEPSEPVTATAPSPRPVATPLVGPGNLEITGAARNPCVAPPSGCGYGATLVLPGGDALHADFGLPVDGAPLLLEQGLPASLPSGAYALVFEVIAGSDVESLVPYDDGSSGPAPPERRVACTAQLPVANEPETIRVRVVFNGSSCTVRVRRR